MCSGKTRTFPFVALETKKSWNLIFYFWITLLQCYFHLQTARAEQKAESDMQSEYARQREHLEKSVASLRRKLTKDSEIHRADTVRVMQVSGRK